MEKTVVAKNVVKLKADTAGEMKRNKILLINTQFVELYISGFTNRFIGLWCHLQKKGEAQEHVHWLTNRSLWKKYFAGQKPPEHVTVIRANLKYFAFTSRLFYPLYIIYLYYRKKCTSVHVATSIFDSLYLVRLFNLFKIPYCFTFASNGLDMASNNDDRARKKWQKLFLLAKNIEVLNPANTVDNFGGRKFISPNSFPYIKQFQNLPEELLTNKNRENNIVFCGSFIRQKNPLLAIEGFEHYLKTNGHRNAGIKLQMIGRGELMPQVKKEIDRVNAEFKGNYIELVPESLLVETLSKSKIFLSLQDYTNYPSQSLMESMLFCNSVIATNYGETTRLVEASRNNILISEKDPRELGEAIATMLQDWKLNLLNKELIEEKFTVEIFANYFLDLHKEITSAKN